MKKLNIIGIIILLFSCQTVNAVDDATLSKYSTLNTKINNITKTSFLSSHPINSIYITTSSDESTTTKMASKYGGTWEVYGAGKTLYGYSSSNSNFSTINKTGGTASNTLNNVKYLPKHTHSISHTHSIASYNTASSSHTHATIANTLSVSLTLNSAGSHSHGYSQGNVSGGSVFVIGANSSHSGMADSIGFDTYGSQGYWPGSNKTTSSIASAGSHSHSVSGTITIPKLTVPSSGAHTHSVPSLTTGDSSNANSGSSGASAPTAITNLGPYITVYMYKRIS